MKIKPIALSICALILASSLHASEQQPQKEAKEAALRRAASNGKVHEVERLIASGTDVNVKKRGVAPLHLAATNGQLLTARALLQNGADVEQTCAGRCTPLRRASEKGYVQVMQELLGRGALFPENSTDRLMQKQRSFATRWVYELKQALLDTKIARLPPELVSIICGFATNVTANPLACQGPSKRRKLN